MGLSQAKKISIVGNSRAGKSTFANKLGKRLNISVYSVDKIFWLSGWETRGHDSFSVLHDAWMGSDTWIIEGVGYWPELEKRLLVSDKVIFIDLPAEICKNHAVLRIAEEKITPNLNVTAGCVYAEVQERQMQVIDYFHDQLRPRLMNCLSGLGAEKVKIIKCMSELDRELIIL